MKVRVDAFLGRYFKNILLVIGFASCTSNFIASSIVTQFRTPMSLRELLHEGLLLLQDGIDSLDFKNNETEVILTASLTKVEHLQNLYDGMNSKSGLNEIHMDEILQSWIDRIDQMIQKLEHNASDTQDHSDLIKKNIELLQTLRSTLGH